jgi:flagellar FliL protein
MSYFLRLGLALLAAVVSVGCKSAPQIPNARSGKSNTPQVKGILHLESFVVNLADSEENCFLRVGIDLGLEHPLPTQEGKGGEGAVPIARVRDCILTVLSTWHSAALLAPEGKQKLKAELLGALHQRVPELGVREIYFTDFLVQR